jgi:serine protease Do
MPGKKVDVIVFRGGKKKELQVKVGSLGNGDSAQIAKKPVSDDEVLGLVVENLPQAYETKWGVAQGVVVKEVIPGQAGANAGLLAGDVITMLDNKAIANVSEFREIAAKLPKDSHVAMHMIRRGRPGFIAIRTE